MFHIIVGEKKTVVEMKRLALWLDTEGVDENRIFLSINRQHMR